jgi:hypothetical protein
VSTSAVALGFDLELSTAVPTAVIEQIVRSTSTTVMGVVEKIVRSTSTTVAGVVEKIVRSTSTTVAGVVEKIVRPASSSATGIVEQVDRPASFTVTGTDSATSARTAASLGQQDAILSERFKLCQRVTARPQSYPHQQGQNEYPPYHRRPPSIPEGKNSPIVDLFGHYSALNGKANN